MFLFLLKEEGKDKEFTGEVEEEVDLEDTIDEQEKHERKVDYSKELRDLEDEGDLPMDELYKKYAAAYDSDFDVPEEESDFDEDETEEEEEETDEDEGNDQKLLFSAILVGGEGIPKVAHNIFSYFFC
jgi:E1A-binding protein p400